MSEGRWSQFILQWVNMEEVRLFELKVNIYRERNRCTSLFFFSNQLSAVILKNVKEGKAKNNCKIDPSIFVTQIPAVSKDWCEWISSSLYVSVKHISISNFTLHFLLLQEVSGGCISHIQYRPISIMLSVMFRNSLISNSWHATICHSNFFRNSNSVIELLHVSVY